MGNLFTKICCLLMVISLTSNLSAQSAGSIKIDGTMEEITVFPGQIVAIKSTQDPYHNGNCSWQPLMTAWYKTIEGKQTRYNEWFYLEQDYETSILEQNKQITIYRGALLYLGAAFGNCTSKTYERTSNTIKINVLSNLLPSEQNIRNINGNLNDPIKVQGMPNPLDYEYIWEYSYNKSTWYDVKGADRNLTTLYSTGKNTNTHYIRCKVHNKATGYEAMSNQVMVNVQIPEHTPGTIATNQTICLNSKPSRLYFSVKPSGGDGIYTYEWCKSNDNIKYNVINGGNGTDTYLETSLLTQDTYYKCAVKSNGKVEYTNPVKITMSKKLEAGTITGGSAVCINGSAVIRNNTDASGGLGNTTYKWFYVVNGSLYEMYNENGNELNLKNLQITRRYIRKAYNSCGSENTNEVTINVASSLNGGQIELENNQTEEQYCYGAVVSKIKNKTSANGGIGNTTYEWQKSTNNGNGWGTCGTSFEYDPNPLTVTTWFRRLAKNQCGEAFASSIIKMTIHQELKAGSLKEKDDICYGADAGTIQSAISASGGFGEFLYQWEKSQNLTDWSELTNVSRDNENYRTKGFNENTYLRRSVINTCGTKYTNPIKITVLKKVDGGTIGTDQEIIYNSQPNNLNGTEATGGSYKFKYQWQQSSNNTVWENILVNSKELNYQPTNLKQDTWFRRIATEEKCETKESNVIKIIVFSDLTSGIIKEGQNICYGNTPNEISGSEPSGGTGKYYYQWQTSINAVNWNNVVLSGNKKDFQPGNLTTTTYIQRLVSNDEKNWLTSNVITISVKDKIALPETNVKSVYCLNQDAEITVLNNTNAQQKWYENLDLLKVGSKLTLQNLEKGRVIKVISEKDNCESEATELSINIDPVKADFYPEYNQIEPTNSVKFINTSFGAISYDWNFGEGENSTLESPYQYYYFSGHKTVTLEVKSVNNCTNIKTIKGAVAVGDVTAINENWDETLWVYPNPTKDKVTIEGVKNTQIKVIGTDGILYKTLQPSSNKTIIEMNNLNPGVYILQINRKNNVNIIKIVKE